MGKKKLRAKYISKGQRASMDQAVCRSVRADRTSLEKELHKYDAYLAGKQVYTTIPNPNSEETAKRFIRVPLDHVSKNDRKKKYVVMVNNE